MHSLNRWPKTSNEYVKSQAEPMTSDSLRQRVSVGILGVSVLAATWMQGGFYREQFVWMLVGVIVAAITAVRRSLPSKSVCVFIACMAVTAVWSMSVGQWSGDRAAAQPFVALSLCLAAAAYAVDAFSTRARETYLYVIIGSGLLASVSSWIGVAFHREPWALLSQGLWRGASTITYANAAAAFIAIAMAVAMLFFLRRATTAMLTVLYVLALGWLTTMSRASGIAVVLAFASFVVLTRDRRQLVQLWPLVPSTGVAFAALLTSMPEHGEAKPLGALAGALLGAALVIGCRRLSVSKTVLSTVAMVFLALGTVAAVNTDAFDRLADTRFNALSKDREDLTRVTWEQLKEDPLVGVGPGALDFTYVNHEGTPVVAQFTHNEYLQVAAEIGLAGLSFVLIAFGALVFIASRIVDRAARATGIAVLVSFGVHSALDFLWHIPLLPLAFLTVVVAFNDHNSEQPASIG
jgi:hypothetical protein